jgi:predicted nucleotidyltransferase
MEERQPLFPTSLHQEAAEIITGYFLNLSSVDTVLVVNSCARGQAVPESDLDFAILVKPGTTAADMKEIERCWKLFEERQSTILAYKRSGPFAHLHLDIIDGSFAPSVMGNGEPIDYFEIEIGNIICYSAPMTFAGPYFQELQNKWLPYYDEKLRLQRFASAKNACAYDLDQIPNLIKRELYFHAFETLYKAFQEYLQTLFIAAGIYPIAYNKWIKEQLIKYLRKPDLYIKLSPILSIANIESDEIYDKSKDLRILLNNLN